MSLAPLPFEIQRLNDLTAEKVMRYQKCSMGWLGLDSRSKMWVLEWAFENWKPTSDKEQALMVLDKLSEKWVIFISSPCAVEAGVIHQNGKSETLVEAESLPLAICRLACKLEKPPL